MKNLLPFLILLFSMHCATAQVVDIALQNQFFSLADDVTQANDGNWIVGGMQGYYPGWPQLRPVVYKLDNEGNIIWEHSFSYEDGAINAVNSLPDGGYIVSGFESGCDYGVASFVARLNEDGALVWREDGVSYHTYLSRIFCEHIVVGEYGAIKIYSFDGNEVAEFNEGYGGLDDIEISNDGESAYIVTSDSLIHVACQDLGTTAATLNEGGIKMLAALPEETGHHLAGISEDVLLLLNESLAIENTLEFSSGRIPEDIIFCDNKYVVLTRAEAPYGYYLEFYDLNLNPVGAWEVGDKYREILGIKCMEEKIGIWGRDLARKGQAIQNYNAFFQVLETEPQSGIDIALEAVTAEFATLDVVLDPQYCWPGPAATIDFEGLTASITNEGSTTVNSCKVNFMLNRCSFICSSIAHYEQTLEGLNLNPGASINVSLPDFSIDGMISSGEVDNYEACFWVSVPNNRVDTDHNNDSSCMTISTSTEEPEVATAIQLVPNPVKDMIQLRMTESIKTYQLQIYNQTGQLVFQQAGEAIGNALAIDFSPYPAGLYYYLLQNDNNSFTKSFVKVD